MTDLSKLSNEELQALYSKPQGVAGMSDADLMAAYKSAVAAPVTIEGGVKAAGTGLVKGSLDTAESVAPAVGGLSLGPAIEYQRRFIEPFLHKAGNKTEKIIQGGFELAPAAAAGPSGVGGGIMRQALTRGLNAVRYGLAPGVASEGAGQAVEAAGGGKTAEGAARIAAALAAPAALARRGAGYTPSRDELYSAADQGYARFRGSGAEYSLGSVAKMADDIGAKLNEVGWSERAVGPVHEVLGALKNVPPGGVAVTAKGLEAARRELGVIAQKAARRPDGAPEAAAARMAIADLSEFVARADPKTVVPGLGKTALEGEMAAALAAGAIDPARKNYAAASRSETIGARSFNAELQADSAHSGANLDNNLRQQIKGFLRKSDSGNSAASRAGFNKAEQDALKGFAEGSAGRNATRTISNILGGGGGLGAATFGLGGAITGGPAGMAMASGPVVGALMKMGQNRAATKALNRVDEQVRLRSPLAEKTAIAAEKKRDALIRALLPVLTNQ